MSAEPDSIRLSRGGRSILLVAFFLTGITSLVFEVVWTRLLLLSLGATPAAVSTVLAALMGGMAVGSAVGGTRLIARHHPVIVYAALAALAGVYGLASPYLLRTIDTASPLVQSIGASVLLLPATIAMGASLPVLARALAVRGAGSVKPAVGVGYLYATNTAGAFLGPLLAVFTLFPAVGLSRSVLLAGCANLIIAGTLAATRKSIFAMPWAATDGAQSRRAAAVHVDRLVIVALAVSGASAMVYEVAWGRTLASVFGSSVYGVSIMLSVFLGGLAGGSAIAAAVLRGRQMPAAPVAVAWLLLGSACTAFASLLVAPSLPFVFLDLYRSLGTQDQGPFLMQCILTAFLMAPSTLLLGALLPVATSAVLGTGDVGATVSRLYTGNLVGSAVGAAAASSVLLAGLGTEASVRAAALVALIVSAVVVVRRARRSVAPIVTAMFAGAIVIGFDPSVDPVHKSFGFYAVPDSYEQYDAAGLGQVLSAHRALYYRDGPTATVAVQEIDRQRLLKINGKTAASTGAGDLETQLLLAHLPLMVSAAARVAMIGWGSGITTGAVLSHQVEQVDAFEIEPAVVEASRFFEPDNGQPLEDPRLRLVVGDARTHLRHERGAYDLIISEPSHPWLTGVANLFTHEFFETAAARLAPDGLICQSFRVYGMSENSTRSLIATFRAVFPHALVFKERDLILLGSRQPIRFSFARMRRLFEQPAIKESLSKGFIAYPADLLVRLSLDERGTETFSRGAVLNTDDNMRLELAAPRSLYRDRLDAIRNAMSEHAPSVVDQIVEYGPEAALRLELAASWFTAGRLNEALEQCRHSLQLDASFDGFKLLGQILHRQEEPGLARAAWERALAMGGDPVGRVFVDSMLRSLQAPGGSH